MNKETAEDLKGVTIKTIELSNYVKPQAEEIAGQDWVTNGPANEFWQYIIDRYKGSPTNAALINSYVERIFGQGLTIVNASTNTEEYARLINLLPLKEAYKIAFDFYFFGSAVMQVIKDKSGKRKPAKIKHMNRYNVVPGKMDDMGKINKYYVDKDWSNTMGRKPKSYPAYGTSPNAKIEILEIKPYTPGLDYFADPSYFACLQYAQLEEEISNYSINHIQNGLSAGWFLVFKEGEPNEEIQAKLERQVSHAMTGSENAGRIMLLFSNGADTAPEVLPVPQNTNHEQWQFWATEARQQIIVGHRVTTPMLFGVKDNTGMGNNANEMQEGNRFLEKYVTGPFQNALIKGLEPVMFDADIVSPMVFMPLEDEDEKREDSEMKEVEMSLSDDVMEALIEKGEEIGDEWELVEEREATEHTLSEHQLEAIIQLASVKGDSRKSSEQDTSLFKIRYVYAGHPLPQRSFCQKLMFSGKAYRAEDLKAAEDAMVNQGFGPRGADTYSIWLYKGGVNCKHWWKRVIYLKKGNKQIGVNQARKLINELEPSKRKDAKWDQNDPKVSQSASPSNNHWKLN